MKKSRIILVIITLFILLISFISASDYIKIQTEEKVSIFDSSLQKTQDIFLINNTDYCTRECEAYVLFDNKQDVKLFDDLILKNKKNQTTSIKIFGSNIIEDNQKLKYFNEEKSSGQYLLKIYGEKNPLESVDWQFVIGDLVLDIWQWWNSWQDWNDDFEDGILNSTLWENDTEINRFGAVSNSGTATTTEETSDDGFIKIYTQKYESAGGIGKAVAVVNTKQDFNDGKDYIINFSLNFTQSNNGYVQVRFYISNGTIDLVDSGDSDVEYINANHMIYQYYGSDYNSIPFEDFSINIYANRTLILRNSTAVLNKTQLSLSDEWRIGFASQSFAQSGVNVNSDLRIYNFTTLADLSIATTLLSPGDSSTINSDTASFLGHFNMSQAIHNVTNSTLYVWNSSNVLVYSNETIFDGLSTSEELNITNTFDDYGVYHWNFLAFGTEGSNYVSDWGDSNFTFILNDTLAPAITFVSPGATSTSKTLNINASVVEKGGLDYCFYNITKGASTEKSNTEFTLEDLYLNDSYDVSQDLTTYTINIWCNDTNGNSVQDSLVVYVNTLGDGGSGGGGGVVGTTQTSSEEESVDICAGFKTSFINSWEDSSNEEDLFERTKLLWNDFWDYSLCESAASIVPI